MARSADGERMHDDWFWACMDTGGNPKTAWGQLSEEDQRAWHILAESYLERED